VSAGVVLPWPCQPRFSIFGLSGKVVRWGFCGVEGG